MGMKKVAFQILCHSFFRIHWKLKRIRLYRLRPSNQKINDTGSTGR